MTDEQNGLETSSSVPPLTKPSGHRIFASLMLACGLFLVILALIVYAGRRTTHMSTGVFAWVLTLGSAALLSGIWVFLRADALAARAAVRASEPTWADDGAARIAAAEAGLVLPVVVAERYPRIEAVVETLILGTLIVLFPSSQHAAPVRVTVTLVIVASIAGAVGCFRGLRMTLRIDRDGILVRNYFRSYRIGFPDVRCFSDGSIRDGANGPIWALKIMLHNGRAVTARATMARSGEKSRVLAVVTASARCFGIPAELTGKAVRR